MFKDEMSQLNKNQLKAVEHNKGPAYVIAGAGTGKTKTLTMRIANLINQGVNPENILAVTFTNKAAGEVRERVNKAIYPKSVGSWLYTFHAFGNKILRKHAPNLNLNYSHNFTIIDGKESKDLIEQAMRELNLYDGTIRLGDMAQYVYHRKMENITSMDEDMELIFERYVDLSIRNQLMDFTDLVTYTKKLFVENPQILKFYQNKFEHILIDEFQDTDKIQYEIIKMLNEGHNNVFVVGDPDQSIYSFRGARYENNELFIKEFNAEVITLDQNYRSTNNILKSANKLIKFNKSRTTEKDLKSSKALGVEVQTEYLDDEYEETYFVLQDIKKKLDEGVKPQEIAILYRNNTLSRIIEHELVRNNIPYVIYGGLSFYERKEIKDILAYIKLAMDTNNDFFLKRIINVPRRGIGKKSYEILKENAKNNRTSIFDATKSSRLKLSDSARASISVFRRIILNIQYYIEIAENLGDIIDYVFEQVNYQKELDRDDYETREERYDNIQELKSAFEMADKLEGTNVEKLQTLLDEITLFTETESKSVKNSIILSTVHQVKGLEFDVVYVIGMEDDLFPNFRAKDQLERLEEERRLFYVAITRAKEKLIITNTQKRTIYGMFKFNRQSPFLNEI